MKLNKLQTVEKQINLADLASNFLNRNSGTGAFLWIYEIFENVFAKEHLRKTASENGTLWCSNLKLIFINICQINWRVVILIRKVTDKKILTWTKGTEASLHESKDIR